MGEKDTFAEPAVEGPKDSFSDWFLRKQASRKWQAFLLLSVAITVAFMNDSVNSAEWLGNLFLYFSVFVTGNVIQKGVEALPGIFSSKQ